MARRVPPQNNPWFSNVVAFVDGTIAAEAGDARTVSLQFRQAHHRADVTQRITARAWFSSDATGDVPADNLRMPAGGYAAGTDGTLIPGPLAADRIYPTPPILAIDATAEQFKLVTNTVTGYIGGAAFTKAPATGIAFSAAHVVTASKFGVILVQVTAAGVVSTKVPASPQAYTTAASARAALPFADAGNLALGWIAIAAKAATWTANTDDMTNGSDLTTATFNSAPANGNVAPTFTIVSEADGDADVVVTDARVVDHYLNIALPDGSVTTIGPITFV